MRGINSMTIEDRVKNIITDNLGVNEEEVTPEAHFADDLGCDSLDRVELAMAFEEEFGIDVPDDDMVSISTVAEVHAYLHARTGIPQ